MQQKSQIRAIRNFAKEMKTHGTKQVAANLEYIDILIDMVNERDAEIDHKDLLLKQFQKQYDALERKYNTYVQTYNALGVNASIKNGAAHIDGMEVTNG